MKSLAIKKRIERRKVKSRRNIQAFWLAKANEAYQWCVESNEEIRELEAEPVVDGNYYGHDAMVSEEMKRLKKYEGVLTNALCRYQQAILK